MWRGCADSRPMIVAPSGACCAPVRRLPSRALLATLRQGDRERASGEIGLHLRRIEARRQPIGLLQPGVMMLGPVLALPVLPCFFAAVSADGEDVRLDGDLDIAGAQTRQI